MARVLIGWELGAFRGHAVRMARFGRALAAAGHRVDLAGQRIDILEQIDGGAVWQAPVWPRLLVGTPRPPAGATATMGDILGRLGLADEGAFAALVRGWDGIVATVRPDLVVAEYAPALLVAARSRLPTVSTGIGFDTPPPDMPRFPSLMGQAAGLDEQALLRTVNAGLAGMGREPLPTLPQLFAADRTVVPGLDELDPYALWRPEGMATPMLDMPLPPLAPAEEEELFVYWAAGGHGSAHMWEALARAAVPVRVYGPGLENADRAMLASKGFAIETEPLGWDEIARRSRLVLSHGGTGFVTAALVHGRPQVIVHADLEKAGNGIAVERLGLGAALPLADFDIDAVARAIAGLHADPALAVRAQQKAAEFRTRFGEAPEAMMVRAVEELLAPLAR